jgi:mono/diheme cytochrome c family protein
MMTLFYGAFGCFVWSFGATQEVQAGSGEVKSFLEKHCVQCHGADSPEGNLDLTSIEFALNDRSVYQKWLLIHDRIEKGEMPPREAEQPSKEGRAAMVSMLAGGLKKADVAYQETAGRTVVRRLNRSEFENTLTTLFEMPVSIREMLPLDATYQGFDTVGSALNVSAVQMASYLNALDTVLDSATKLYEKPERQKHRLSFLNCTGTMQVYRKSQPAVIQKDGLAIFATERMSHFHGLLSQYVVPHDGRYRVRVSAYAIRSPDPVTLTVRVGGSGHKESLEVPHVVLKHESVYEGSPQMIEWEGWLQRGHYFHVYPSSLRPMRFIGDMKAEDYQGPGVVVQWLEVDGPIFDTWPPPSHQRLWGDLPTTSLPDAKPHRDYNAHLASPPSRPVELKIPIKGKKDSEGRVLQTRKIESQYKIYPQADMPNRLQPTLQLQPKNAKPDAAKLIVDFYASAIRRKVDARQAEPYVELAAYWLDQGADFEQAVRTAYKAILTSPEFLYFEKPEKLISPSALAERLSYFLWRLPPDEQLLSLAKSGKLGEPDVLRQQAERLLNDPRSRNFINDFAGQWLDLRLIDFTSPDSDLYPEFDSLLQWSMVEETRAFVDEMLRKDLSTKNIVDSDFVMVNDRLSKLYDIPGVRGFEIRRVDLPNDSLRGGLLTQGSILKVTANGTATSPVIRGKWVLERILGDPPNPPPPGVPAIEPDIRGATTVLEQLKQHRSVESCAVCHAKIDPPGVALECFDVMGAYREKYRALDPEKAEVKVSFGPERPPVQKYRDMLPVVSADHLPNGETFKNVNQFKQLLLKEPSRLATNVAEKLILFGTGAAISFADREEVDRIVKASSTSDFGFRTLVHQVIQSPLFSKP